MNKCTHSGSKIIGILHVPHYRHLMSDKIRMHLIKRFWQSKGVSEEKALEIATQTINLGL